LNPCGFAVVGLGHDQPASQVFHQAAGVVARPLADQEGHQKLRRLVQSHPEIHVADVVPAGLLFCGEPGLLLLNERPDFIALDRQTAQLLSPTCNWNDPSNLPLPGQQKAALQPLQTVQRIHRAEQSATESLSHTLKIARVPDLTCREVDLAR
jgi:hypothetical protein